MNYDEVIEELEQEREKITQAIAILQALKTSTPVDELPGMPKRRGRKGMPQAERLEVSRRMKKYWAARRRQA